MKVTVQKVIEISSALEKLCLIEDLFCSYQVAKNMNLVSPFVDEFKQDKKVLIDTYVNKNEDGSYLIKEDKYQFGDKKEEFDGEVKKTIDKEVDIDFVQISITDFKNNEGKKINPPAIVFAVLDEVIIIE